MMSIWISLNASMFFHYPLLPTNEVRVGRTRKGLKSRQVAQGTSKDAFAQVPAASLVWIMGRTSDELVVPPFFVSSLPRPRRPGAAERSKTDAQCRDQVGPEAFSMQ